MSWAVMLPSACEPGADVGLLSSSCTSAMNLLTGLHNTPTYLLTLAPPGCHMLAQSLPLTSISIIMTMQLIFTQSGRAPAVRMRLM